MRAIYHDTFKKKFNKLPIKIQEQFRLRLVLFLLNPLSPMLNNHSVDKVFLGRRSINVNGDYRAIFRQYEECVMFTDIDTHAKLYR